VAVVVCVVKVDVEATEVHGNCRRKRPAIYTNAGPEI
jgi:hypothetical protein